jgi:hypothetical protein
MPAVGVPPKISPVKNQGRRRKRMFVGTTANPVMAKIGIMTARDEILAALPSIEGRSADDTFGPQDVIDELRRRGSGYAESTIRTHVVGRMCANAADHHARVYDDLVRVSDGRYRRR